MAITSIKVITANPTQKITGVVSAQPKAKIVPLNEFIGPKKPIDSKLKEMFFPETEQQAISSPATLGFDKVTGKGFPSNALIATKNIVATGLSNIISRTPLSGRDSEDLGLNFEDKKYALKYGPVGSSGYESALMNRYIIKNPEQVADVLSIGKTKISKELLRRLTDKYGDNIANQIVKNGGQDLALKAIGETGENSVKQAGIKLPIKINTYKFEAGAFPKSMRQAEQLAKTPLEKIGFKQSPVISNGLTGTTNPLIQEAKKYKTAEEFVKAQNDPLREFKSSGITKDIGIGKGTVNEAINDIGGINNVRRGKTPIDKLETTENINTNSARYKAVEAEVKGGKITPIIADEYLRVMDGHHRLEAYKNMGMKEVPVIVPKVTAGVNFQTTSQLTDIWKKANATRELEAGFINPSVIADDVKSASLKTRTELVDRFAPIKDLTKGKVSEAKDPYIQARLYSGHLGKVQNRLDDLSRVLKPNKDILPEAKKFALLDRYEELSKRGVTKFPDNLTPDLIKTQKAELELQLGDNLERVKKTVEGLRQYSNKMLTEAKDAGIISQEAYNTIIKNNEKYVPLQRLEYLADQADSIPRGSNSFSVSSQSLVKGIKGSTKEVADPIESIVRNTYKAQSLIERNKVALKIADLADDPQFEGIITKVKGEVPPDMEKISVFRNGIKEEYAVPKNVGAALKGLSKEEADIVTKWASLSSRALRTGATTLNLAFLPSNIIRDFQTATLVSKVGFTPLDWVKGFAEAIKKGKDYKAFLESGGSFSGFFEQGKNLPKTVKGLTESNLSKTVKTIINPFELIRKGGEITELAPRLGVFRRSLRKGLTGTEAAFNARNATVDFAKSGNVMKIINQWVPFLNARLQGTVNTFGAIKNKPISSAVKLSALVGIPALATYLNNTRNYPEVWKDIGQFEKDNNYLIIYGDEQDEEGNYTQVIKIPKGDIGRTFGNVQENFMAFLDGKDKKSFNELALQIGSDISPISFEKSGEFSGGQVLSGILPPGIKGGIESVTNKNLFTGFDIVPKSMENASPKEQYDQNTSFIAKKLGKFLNWSPKKIDNFIGTQFGGLGRQLIKPSTAGQQITGRFTEAKGGQEGKNIEEKAKKAVEEQANRKLDIKRKAQKVLDDLEANPESAADEFEKLSKSSPDIAKVVVDLKEKKDMGFTSKDYVISELGVENGERARFLVGIFGELKDEEKAALWDDLVGKKLITKNVADEMYKLLNK